MAQIILQRDGKKVYVQHFVDASRFTVGDRPYRHRPADWATQAAKMLRENAEPTARAVTEVGQGELPLESETAIVSESAAPTADNRPTTFRGITPEQIGAKWFVKWHDEITRQDYSISGNTPQQCFENLFGNEHPCVVRYRDSLPPEDEAQPQAAVIPTPQPVAPSSANRVLRPGSQPDVRTVDLPERRSYESNAASAQQASFAQWEQTCSVAQLKDRLRTDVSFADWYHKQEAAPAAQKGVF